MPNNPGNKSYGSQSSGSQGNSSQPGQESNLANKPGPQQGQQKQGQQNQQGSQRSQQSQQSTPQSSSGQNVRLNLTPEQQAQIRKATGRDASSLELSVQEIEQGLGESGETGPSTTDMSKSSDESMGSESEF